MALVVAACGPIMVTHDNPEPRYLHLALPGVLEPLQVSDLTGSVIGVELAVWNPQLGGRNDTLLVAAPGRQDAKMVGWLGGCEQRADIAVDPPSEPGADPTITLKLLPGEAPCPTDVPRRVVVVFDHVVESVRYNFDVVK